jgi:hypothetical protein
MDCRCVSRLAVKGRLSPAVIGIVVGLFALVPCAARGAEVAPSMAPTHLRPHDQLWLVSCRGVVHQSPDGDVSHLRYTAYRTHGGWSSATREDFQTTAARQAVTCVLVLGNGYTASETQAMGQKAYRRLVAGLPIELAVRFVVWSWPSDPADTGPIKDLRIKAGRTWQVAHWLARWLDEVEPTGAVSLLGTSFGARIVMESLELRAADTVDPAQVGDTVPAAHTAINVVLISAAVDNDWLLPGRQLDMALSQVDRLLLVNNSSDRVLKRYHWLYGRRSKATALGSAGLPVSSFASVSDKIAQYDAAPIIGRQHGCGAYFDSPRLVALMRNCLFSSEASPAPPDSSPLPEVPGHEGASIPLASDTSGNSK